MDEADAPRYLYLEIARFARLENYPRIGEYDENHKERQILDEFQVISTLAFYCSEFENSQGSRP